MKASFFFPLVIIFSLLFLSCDQRNSDPISSDETGQTLNKTEWFTSPLKTWETETYCPPNYSCYTSSKLSYSFSYYTITNNNFTFNYYRGGWVIDIKVDGILETSVSYFDQNHLEQSYWTDWFSFTHNGKNMKAKFWISYFTVRRNNGIWDPRYEPRNVQVQVEEKYVSPPSNFTVSPFLHNNYNQVVSMSWTPSTDTDVTGYEIHRMRYYLVNGQLGWTSFTLAKTFTTRTASSWQDSPAWGEGARNGIGYRYIIRSVSSTLGIVSNFSIPRECYLEEYNEILP